MRRLPSILAFAGCLWAVLAHAHDGVDHSSTPAPVAATTSYAASSAHHELVVAAPVLTPLAPARLELSLSDWATNAPVEGATLAVEFRPRTGGRAVSQADAMASGPAGVYVAELAAPAAGAYNLLVKVHSELGEDEFALTGFVITTPHPPARSWPHGPFVWIGLGVLAALLFIVVMARRRPRASLAVALVLWAALRVPFARAHEGHDHAAAPSAAAAATIHAAGADGAEVFLPKTSQFVLGVRTELVRFTAVAPRLTLIGRVAPRGGSELEVVAPQAGRVYFAGGAAPRLGERVLRGQSVATLVIVDSLSLRAPLSGVVTSIQAVHGQRVEAGQKLLSILDPTVVWVHADVFAQDLGAMEKATRAVITTEGYPGVAFAGRRLTLGATTGDVPGAVEAWFEVPDPAARLRVGLPVQVDVPIGPQESLVLVPRDAVQEQGGRARVYLHTAPERFMARAVTVVTRVGDRVAVRGLAAGERVVVLGAQALLSAAPQGAADAAAPAGGK